MHERMQERIKFLARADYVGTIPQMREALVATVTIGLGFYVGGDDGHGSRSTDELVAFTATLLQTLFGTEDEHGARRLATVIVKNILSDTAKDGAMYQNAAGRWELAACGKCEGCKAAGVDARQPADGVGKPKNTLPC